MTVRLYRDGNGNGQIDSAVEALITSATTDSAGHYAFHILPSGAYLVVVSDSTLPGATYQTADPDQPNTTCTTCDALGRATLLTTDNFNIDFGYRPYGSGSIGDTVYRDMNGDGSQAGPQETGIASITVWLEVDLNGDGSYARVEMTETDADGHYLFGNLPSAAYRVVVDEADADLPEDGFDHGYIPSAATSDTLSLTSGSAYLDADFGFMPMGVLGDTIYWDANGNGQQDWLEGGISNVRVHLYLDTNNDGQPDGSPIASASTTITGFYLFTGLVQARYVVVVDTSDPDLKGAALTGDPDTNGISCTDPSNPLLAYCDSQIATLIRPGTVLLGADFGYQPSGVIGDLVWYDANRNGLQDPGESGLVDVQVTITNGSETRATTTDYDGRYSFDNLADGTWSVTFQQPANMTPTLSDPTAVAQGVGSAGATATPVPTAHYTLTPGSCRTEVTA